MCNYWFFALVFTLSNIVSPSITFPADTTGSSSSDNLLTTSEIPKKWVANLFYETLANFTVSSDEGSSECMKQSQMYARHLENDSYWAVQMSDSWSRYPNGLLVGTTHQMGVYDECINVIQPIQGKYCIPFIKLTSTSSKDFTIDKPHEPNMNDHAWREILGYIDYNNQFDRRMVKFGICIPDACTTTDLEISLQREFDKHFLPHQVKPQVQVDSILCSTSKDVYPYGNGFYLVSLLLGLLLIMSCSSTMYHFMIMAMNTKGEKSNKIPEVVKLFSMICNGRNLIKYDRDNELNIFNGLKVVAMILVLFGHKFIYLVINPISYGKQLEMIYTTGPDFLLTSINLVDPFFYITGYLMYVMLIPQFNKPGTKWYQIPLVIVYKYSMVLPSYVVMMLLTAFVIPHMSNGPFWASKIWPEADKCKNYWWANILAVSNLIEAENQCLVVSWYISCLLQFLVIGSVVIYIYVKNRRVGIYLIVSLLFLSLIIPSVMTYIYQAWSIVRLMRSALDNPRSSFEFNHLYRGFYLRGAPYFAGLLAGITVEEMKKREIKLSKFVVYFGTIAITAIATWVQLYGAVFYDVHRPYDVMEQSLYSALSHCTWTVILFWVTVCHFIRGYGPLEKLLNNRLVVPLGRLSYAVYLVNITVMMVVESRQRVTLYPSPEFIIDGWISSTFRTYLSATMLYLIIEAPFGLLIKKVLYGKKYVNYKDRSSSSSTINSKIELEQKDLTVQ